MHARGQGRTGTHRDVAVDRDRIPLLALNRPGAPHDCTEGVHTYTPQLNARVCWCNAVHVPANRLLMGGSVAASMKQS